MSGEGRERSEQGRSAALGRWREAKGPEREKRGRPGVNRLDLLRPRPWEKEQSTSSQGERGPRSHSLLRPVTSAGGAGMQRA